MNVLTTIDTTSAGVFVETTVVVSFHPNFLTKVDRAYTVQCFYMEADKTVNIDLEVYATVLADEQDEFDEIYATNKNRVREQINLTIQAAEPSELSDGGLGLIKRRILERTNRALGKPLVREVFLTRFNFVQR